MTRRGQGTFIAVSITVVITMLVLTLFPGKHADDATLKKLRAESQTTLEPPVGQSEPAIGQSGPVITPAKERAVKNSPLPKRTLNQRKTTQHIEDIWQVIHLGKPRIGYSRTTFQRLVDGAEVRIRTIQEVHMTVLRFGQTTRMSAITRTVESADGNLISFESETGTGRKPSRMSGRIVNGRMTVDIKANGRNDRRYVDWKDGVKSPTYQDRLLRAFPMKPGEIRRFTTFDPPTGRFNDIRLAAENYRSRKLPDGRTRKLLRVRVTQSLSPTEVVETYLDEKGVPVFSESEFINKSLTHFTVTEAKALETLQGAELDIGLKSIIFTAPIFKPHDQWQIVYRITMEGGDPAKFVATNDRQKVRRINDRTIELTVSKSSLPKRSIHVRCDPEYVNSSRYLQSNDSRVREHARRAAGLDTDEVKIALNMERYVSKKIRDKNFSTALATAADVARDLQGDCTEHAVLLAAMLRHRRIPSRIAVGLVYDGRTGGFVSHMWTEAWLGGQWTPLDATRGQGKIGPAHIKLADASFSDKSAAPIVSLLPLMNVLGKWKITVRKTADGPTIATPKSRFPFSSRRTFNR